MKSKQAAAWVGMALLIAASVSACGDGEGDGQKTKGQFEAAAGNLTGDQHLKREGKKDEVVGGVKNAFGDVKHAFHDATK